MAEAESMHKASSTRCGIVLIYVSEKPRLYLVLISSLFAFSEMEVEEFRLAMFTIIITQPASSALVSGPCASASIADDQFMNNVKRNEKKQQMFQYVNHLVGRHCLPLEPSALYGID